MNTNANTKEEESFGTDMLNGVWVVGKTFGVMDGAE
jgi:hypothetical protein